MNKREFIIRGMVEMEEGEVWSDLKVEGEKEGDGIVLILEDLNVDGKKDKERNENVEYFVKNVENRKFNKSSIQLDLSSYSHDALLSLPSNKTRLLKNFSFAC
jgi:hypothetical protein